MQARVRTVALAAGLAIAASACSFSAGSAKSLDQGSVEDAISEALTEEVGIAPESITCDGVEDLEVVAGNTFTCVGTAPAGDTFDAVITLTDDDGAFSVNVPG